MAIPAFGAAILGGLVSVAGSIVGRVLIALGIAYVTYTGLDTLLDWIKGMAMNSLQGMPSDILTIVGMLQVDTVINILFSAIAARFMLNGVRNGSITRMLIK